MTKKRSRVIDQKSGQQQIMIAAAQEQQDEQHGQDGSGQPLPQGRRLQQRCERRAGGQAGHHVDGAGTKSQPVPARKPPTTG